MPDSLAKYYGDNFPGFDETTDGKKWQEWVDGRWNEQKHSMNAKRLHAARHRNFRQGRQWISSRDGRTWHEPRHDQNTIRSVLNLIGPGLDYRLGVLREQRPGFQFEPTGGDIEKRESAEAQQNVVEYYYNTLKAWLVFNDAFQAAQTDGVSFVHVYKDKRKGNTLERTKVIAPGDERYEVLKANGFKVREDGMVVIPLSATGEEAGPEDKPARVTVGGDISHRVVYMQEVIADPESKTINGPYDKCKWFIIRRIRDLESARQETGIKDLESDVENRDMDPIDESPDTVAMRWSKGLPPFPTTRKKKQSGIYEYLIFFNGGVVDEIKDGHWLRVLGPKVIEHGKKLPGGRIPIARVTDGSSDPDLLPRPVMSDWIGDQLAINALYSLLQNHVRFFGSGRILAQKDTIIEESWNTIVGSIVEYSGMKPEMVSGPRAGSDGWKLLEFAIKKLEDKMAWNDLARGQVSGSGSFQDVSGRAVLGAAATGPSNRPLPDYAA